MNDLISRKALLEELREAYDNAHRIFQNQNSPESQECCKLQLRTLRSVIKAVKEAPAVDAEPVRLGVWVKGKWATYPDGYVCDRCSTGYAIPYNFCPNCGAKMDG